MKEVGMSFSLSCSKRVPRQIFVVFLILFFIDSNISYWANPYDRSVLEGDPDVTKVTRVLLMH